LNLLACRKAFTRLSEATLYLATAPKSNSTGAYFAASSEITERGAGPVPIHLMDASRDAKGLGHGQGYQYPHSFPGHFIPQQYLPSNLLGTVFYEPSDQGMKPALPSAWRAGVKPGAAAAAHNSRRKMTTLLLIRHGENNMVGKRLAGRLPEVHLNDNGRRRRMQVARCCARRRSRRSTAAL
jgi:hypothetical protein